MEVSSLSIYAGQVRFRQIHAAKIRLDAGFSAGFHPDFVLIQNLGKIDQRDSDGISFGEMFSTDGISGVEFTFQFVNFFDCLYLQAHSRSFPNFLRALWPFLSHLTLQPPHARIYKMRSNSWRHASDSPATGRVTAALPSILSYQRCGNRLPERTVRRTGNG